MLCEARDLTLARGGVPVLTGLSFGLAAGQALILRGPNGSGKTTLLRTVAGLLDPVSGEISLPPQGVAYAGHADGIKSMLTVTESLAFWARIYGTNDVAPALKAFALEPLADRMAGTLSAGQKRRLGLARLLVTGAPLWVLDEPTVSLDTSAVALFARAVDAHLTRGGAALIATHIDLGLEADVLDLSAFRAAPTDRLGSSDEAFL